MTTELYADLDRSIRRRFGTLSDDARVRRTSAALEANGISVLRAADAAEAKRIVLGLIPDGSQVHHGASQSLEESGIAEEIEKSGRYEPLRPRIWSMDRTTQAGEIRRINEYVFPLEDARAQAAYGVHSGVNKVLIINRELVPGRITVVFVDEVLGF